MATIYDIAKACSLSAATVSYVINGQGDQRKISKSTQERVLEAAREMNFRPNLAAKRLTDKDAQQNYSIALFWPTDTLILEQPVYINSINNAIATAGLPVDIILRPFTCDYLHEEKTLFSTAYYDGALLVSPSYNDVEQLALKPPAIPVVFINRSAEGYCCINVDNDESGAMAALLALKAGDGSIAAMFGAHTFRAAGAFKRNQAFIDECAKGNVDISDSVYYVNNTIEDGYRAVGSIINSGKMKKVLYSSYDSMTLGALAALNAHGYSVGKDVYVISAAVGLPALLEYSIPPVTVIDLQTQALAVRALHMVIALITEQIKEPTRVVYHPKIIYRASCPAL